MPDKGRLRKGGKDWIWTYRTLIPGVTVSIILHVITHFSKIAITFDPVGILGLKFELQLDETLGRLLEHLETL